MSSRPFPGPYRFCSTTTNDGMIIIIIVVLGATAEIVTSMIIRIFEEIRKIFLEIMNH
jgi:hypothetical protein